MVLDLDCEERIKLESQRVNPRPEGARRHETAKYPCRLNDSKKKRERERGIGEVVRNKGSHSFVYGCL